MATLNIKQSGVWTPIAGDVNASNPINDFVSAWTPTPWTSVTFQNGWVNAGGSSSNVQYRKIGDVVYLRGRMNPGSFGLPAFTLPSGFRPSTDIDLPTGGVVSGVWNYAFGYITTGGAYYPLNPNSITSWAVTGLFAA